MVRAVAEGCGESCGIKVGGGTRKVVYIYIKAWACKEAHSKGI
jgi:hypothetical protein